MSRRSRLVLLAIVAALAALGAASSATAVVGPFVPTMSVSHGTMGLQAAAINRIRVTIPRDHAPLFKATIYAPPGYIYNLTSSAGTQVGTVTAQVVVREPIAGAVLPLTGTIVTDLPGNYIANPCAPGLHSAVWVLVLQAAGQELRVPVYVDLAASGETSFASLKMQVCLPSPDIPASAGGATFGAKLIQAQLNLNSVRAPTTRGISTWRALMTPWNKPPDPVTPVPSETVEVRGVIGFPSAAALNLRVNRRTRTVVWSGRLTEGGEGISGVRVQMLRGAARGALRVRVQRNTNARGAYSGTIRFRRAPGIVRIQVRAVVPERVRNVCSDTGASPTPTPRGCVSETSAFFTVTSPVRRVRIT